MEQKSICKFEMVLTVDIGTSGCRAALFNSNGEVVNSAEQHYTYSCIAGVGYAEQDPDHILRAFIEVLKRAGNGYSDVISSVVVDSVLHSLVLLEETGVPLTPLSIWADTRATNQCTSWSTEFERQHLHQKTGCPLTPTYPLARLLWYKERQTEVFDRFTKALSIKSYIIYRIFGLFVEDYSLASASGLFNLHTRTWDIEIMTHLGIQTEQLPELVPVEYEVPCSYTELGQSVGLPREVTWVIGGGDGPMAHLGTVGYQQDIASITLGTSSAVRMLTSIDSSGASAAVWTYLLDKRHFISGMASNNGGNVIDWYMRKFLNTTVDWDTLDAQLESSRFSAGLLFFPYLFAERDNDENFCRCSGFQGVHSDHTPLDFIRGILEGIVFHVVRMFERLVINSNVTAIALSGSLTRLNFVQRTLAGLINIPVLPIFDQHAPQLGSFRLLTGYKGIMNRQTIVEQPSDCYWEKYSTWSRCQSIKHLQG